MPSRGRELEVYRGRVNVDLVVVVIAVRFLHSLLRLLLLLLLLGVYVQ